jgi:S1-C subfamily serine protease
MRAVVLAAIISVLPAGCHHSFNFKQARQSFVFITHIATFQLCEKGTCTQGRAGISGSGFIIGKTKTTTWGMTAAHLCTPPKADKVTKLEHTITVVDINGAAHQVAQAFIHLQTDVCLLELPADIEIPALPLSPHAPEVGDKIYTISAPAGIFNPGMVPIFEGYYAGRAPSGILPIALDAYTIPTTGGSSGAPILNAKGELIGMAIMSRMGFETFALAVPYEIIYQLITTLRDEANP